MSRAVRAMAHNRWWRSGINTTCVVMSRAACIMNQVMGDPSQVMGVPSQVMGDPSQVMGDPSQVTCVPSQVTCVPSQVTCVPSQVTCVPSQVTCVPSQVTCVPSRVTCDPSQMAFAMMRGTPAASRTGLLSDPTAPGMDWRCWGGFYRPGAISGQGGITTEITEGHGEKERIHDSTVFDPEAQTRRKLAEVRRDAKSAEKMAN